MAMLSSILAMRMPFRCFRGSSWSPVIAIKLTASLFLSLILYERKVYSEFSVRFSSELYYGLVLGAIARLARRYVDSHLFKLAKICYYNVIRNVSLFSSD